jgi:flagellar biosynthesis/type III secretory pathway chaperone
MELARALESLGEALLKQDAGAIDDAARVANEALRALVPRSLAREQLEALAQLNRRNGALLAARQANLNWALSRIAPPTRTYGADGQQAIAPPPRRIGSA